MDNGNICNSNYKKSSKSDHIKTIDDQEKLIQYFYKTVIGICPFQIKIHI